jgi:ribulose-phosphate 3-epimerase
MEIIPAILPKDFAELEEKVGLVKGLAALVQVDICDGKFTPKAGWPYKKQDDNFAAILREERGLPFWEDVDYEMDLMIDLGGRADIADTELEKELENWVLSGAQRLIIHWESLSKSDTSENSDSSKKSWKSSGNLLSAAECMEAIITELQGRVEIGIAIGLDTPEDDIAPFIHDIDVVQCMGIAKIGFQGQPFDPRVLAKVRELKRRFPERAVSVDGGVSIETAGMLRDAGVDRLIVGSAIFDNENVVDAYEKFENI